MGKGKRKGKRGFWRVTKIKVGNGQAKVRERNYKNQQEHLHTLC